MSRKPLKPADTGMTTIGTLGIVLAILLGADITISFPQYPLESLLSAMAMLWARELVIVGIIGTGGKMSTQKAMFSYEEVIDLHTESDRVSVIGVHTPTGDTPRKLCPGFFQQFKKYKYLGCKIALVPAATLPADPSQISYGAGEAPIDMRDVLNPILFHGCHGNDLGDILNRLYAANAVTGDSTTMHLGSDSVDMVSYLNGDLFADWDSLDSNISFMESLYYRALTDRTWKKANVQRGFRIAGLRPRVYSLASTMQISGVASLDNIGKVPAPFEIDGEWTGSIQSGIEGTVDIDNPLSNANRFLTPRTIPLGWLDTRNVLTFRNPASAELENDDIGLAPNVLNNMVKQGTVPVELPKIFMGVILLPPAYKQEFYFRMIVTHFFAFAGFRGCSMSNDMLENPNYHDWNEQITSGSGDDPEPEPPEPVHDYKNKFTGGTKVEYKDGDTVLASATLSGCYTWPIGSTGAPTAANVGADAIEGAPVIYASGSWYIYRKDPTSTALVGHTHGTSTYTALVDFSALADYLTGKGASATVTGTWEDFLAMFECTTQEQ